MAPDVQWAGPGLSGDTTGTVTGSGGTYTSELPLNPLSPSHGGDYTCTATYTVDGQTSPEGGNTTTITVSKCLPPEDIICNLHSITHVVSGNESVKTQCCFE